MRSAGPAAVMIGLLIRLDRGALRSWLAAKAEKEGVSLNTLVVSLIAEGLGRRAG